MVSSGLGKTRHRAFPGDAWADRIEALPAMLEDVKAVQFDADDAAGKAAADAGLHTDSVTCPVYCISKALINKVTPSRHCGGLRPTHKRFGQKGKVHRYALRRQM